ncbi:MAG: tetratricopeptide repeat protein [Candidatus Lokiarchaeota archaeon]
MPSKREQKANAKMSRALDLFQQRKVDEAIIELKKALKIYPNHSDATKTLAFIYFRLKKHKKALEYIELALKINTRDANLHYLRGNIYKALGMYDEAIDSLDSSLELAPTNCDVLTLKGNCYREKKEFEKAIDCYNMALSFNEDYGLAKTNKIEVLKMMGKNAEADKLKNDSKIGELGDLDKLQAKASESLLKGKVVDALECYQAMLKLQPTLDYVKQEINDITNGIEIELKRYGITKFTFPKWIKKSKFFNLGTIEKDSKEIINKRYNLVLGFYQLEKENASVSNFNGDIIMMIKNYHDLLEREDKNEQITNDKIKQIKEIEIPSWKNKGLLFYSLGNNDDLMAKGFVSSISLFLGLNKFSTDAKMIPLRKNDMVLCIEKTPGAFERFKKDLNIDDKHIISITLKKQPKEIKMVSGDVLYKTVGSVYQGSARKLLKQGEEMKNANIIITTKGIEIRGNYMNARGIERDYRGYQFDIPWTNLRNIKRTKDGIIRIIRIYTVDNDHINILPLDPHNFSGLGISDARRNTKELFEIINKFRNQIANE